MEDQWAYTETLTILCKTFYKRVIEKYYEDDEIAGKSKLSVLWSEEEVTKLTYIYRYTFSVNVICAIDVRIRAEDTIPKVCVW